MKKFLSILLLILITIEIFYFSSLTGAGLQTSGSNLIPTIYHFTIFFLFAFFLFASIIGNKKIKLKNILIGIIFSLLQAILDESHQIFVPGRCACFEDILVDSLGILFGTLIFVLMNSKLRRKA